MKTILDIQNWNRKEHFEFFGSFEEPFFGMTFKIDCTKAFLDAKANNISFFAVYLHKILVAVNAIEAFRYRIIGNDVVVFDKINASATIGRIDKTFGFSQIEFDSDFDRFSDNLATEIARIQNTSGLFTRDFDQSNLIHFSAVPWVNFSSVSHARSFKLEDSCPKINVGKMTVSKKGKHKIAVSVHVHHGLMDANSVGEFASLLQKLMFD